MYRFFVFLFIIFLLVTCSFAQDSELESALLENDWQKVYDLIDQSSYYDEIAIYELILFEACFEIDCDRSLQFPDMPFEKYFEIRDWLQNFSKKQPGNITIRHLLSMYNLIKGDFEQSRKYADLVLSEDSLYLSAFKIRCYENLLRLQYDSALIEINKVLQIDSLHTHAYFLKGKVYDEMMKYDSAILIYNRCIELNRDYTGAYFQRAMSYSKLNDNSSSISDFNKVLKLDSSYVNVYYNRAENFLKLEEYEKAKSDFLMYLEKSHIDDFIHRGLARYQLYELTEAIEDTVDNKIVEAIHNSFQAWIKKKWKKFNSTFDPKMTVLYNELYAKSVFQRSALSEYDFMLIDGKAYRTKNLYEIRQIPFFLNHLKRFNEKNNTDHSSYLLQSYTILELKKITEKEAIAVIRMEYADSSSSEEKLVLRLEKKKWKILLPERFEMLMLEIYKDI